MERHQMRIGGAWADAAGNGTLEVFDPATGEPYATVPRGTPADVDAAVKAARRALGPWRALGGAERARILYRIAQRLRERADDIAGLESRQLGTAPAGSKHTVLHVAARRFEYFAGVADKLTGRTSELPGGHWGYTRLEPLGVTGHIVPWNGPLWTGPRSIAPALATGNTLVIKPSAEAPISLLELARLAEEECGLPPGVMNVLTGTGSEVGDALAGHPGIDGLWFTGSNETARRVLRQAAEHVTPVVMELGGKSPNLVFADADADRALLGARLAIFANAGQICVAGSRLLVEERIHHTFVERLADMARGMRVGLPHENPDMGPVISASHRDRVLEYIRRGREEAVLVAGGGVPGRPELSRGYFVEPTIFDRVPPRSTLAQEEIFGPVLAVTPFGDLEEAVALANDSPYGLASAVWTQNIQTAHRVAARLEAAQVYVNHYFSPGIELARTPYKASGYGRSEGLDSIVDFVRIKGVSVYLGE